MPGFWLMKSEPSVYPWAQLVREGHGFWDGVRNHLAKRHLMAMQVGEMAFFYHSNEGREIVGIMVITELAHPDPTDASGVFVQVGVAPVVTFVSPVTLRAIKAEPALADMALLRLPRLSVQPVTESAWVRICDMSRTPKRVVAPRKLRG